MQFFFRYLFASLGVMYFNVVFEQGPARMSLQQLNIMLFCYFVWVTLTLTHAAFRLDSHHRFRVAMWVDILTLSVIVLNDPFVVPVTSLVYIVIVLGNGMRYGMSCFLEVLVGSLFAAMVTMTLRYRGSIHELPPAVVFMNVFGGLILVYAYILMSRVDLARRTLEADSRTDALTGLMNRSALFEVADKMFSPVREGKAELVVMFADLDRFKVINDTFGHAEGDRVLGAVGRILKASLRETDVAARYGGDEFVLVLREASLGHAKTIGNRVQTGIRKWAKDNGFDISMTIGIGAAPRHGTDLGTLLNRVDRALYRSKCEQGPGGLCSAETS
jgi:diguanylate cyclase (GGDEF)-like protein